MVSLNVSVKKFEKEGSNFKGTVNVTMGGAFAIHGLKLYKNGDNFSLAMPSRETSKLDEYGKPVYEDIIIPRSKEAYDILLVSAVNAYNSENSKFEFLDDVEPQPIAITKVSAGVVDKSDSKTVGLAQVVLNDLICIKNVRLVKTVKDDKEEVFVSLPSKKTDDGWKDICNPITRLFRETLNNNILEAYNEAKELKAKAEDEQIVNEEIRDDGFTEISEEEFMEMQRNSMSR